MNDRSRRNTTLKAAAMLLAAGVGAGALPRPAVAGDQTAPVPPAAASAGQKVDFIKDVKPIFQASCVKCHGVDAAHPKKKPAAGLRLDDKAAALKGGRSGAAIVPGASKDSLLFKLLFGPVSVPDKDEDKEIDPMPKVKRGEKWKPLSDDQIALIKQWIDQGADWPD